MRDRNYMRSIAIVGNVGRQGCYLLRLRLRDNLDLAFGRFAGGCAFPLPAGEYLYVGSAMGQRGASSLPNRLLRHATRSEDRHPHAIRDDLLAMLTAVGLSTIPPKQKRCHWHVDFLLDQSAVTLTQIYMVCAPFPVEHALADWLATQPETAVIVSGLGASDHRGATHLLRTKATETWWSGLAEQLQQTILDTEIEGRRS